MLQTVGNLPVASCSGCAIPDTSVIVQMDNSRGLNMGNISDDVKDQVMDIAKKSWADRVLVIQQGEL